MRFIRYLMTLSLLHDEDCEMWLKVLKKASKLILS